MSTIAAIPTLYKGIRFRSRLEAKWAAVFDSFGWPWEYEPFDLKGYISDFVVAFEKRQVLVEVKPYMTLTEDEYKPAIKKIEASGWVGPDDDVWNGWVEDVKAGFIDYEDLPERDPKPAIVVGARLTRSHDGNPVIGMYRDGSFWLGGPDVWAECQLLTCLKCKRVFPYAENGERACIRCGDESKHYFNERRIDAESLWARAQNLVQWNRP